MSEQQQGGVAAETRRLAPLKGERFTSATGASRKIVHIFYTTGPFTWRVGYIHPTHQRVFGCRVERQADGTWKEVGE